MNYLKKNAQHNMRPHRHHINKLWMFIRLLEYLYVSNFKRLDYLFHLYFLAILIDTPLYIMKIVRLFRLSGREPIICTDR